MERYLVIFCLLSLFSLSNAQPPKIDISFRENMIVRKAKQYQQMMLSERQKTANQGDYDVTYYSLDLTPDPLTSILNGIVEIVAKVTAPTLDRVELNFWEGMSITSIHHSGDPAVGLSSDMSNDILTIDLGRVYIQGEQIRLTVIYKGRPQDSEYQSFHFDTYNNKPMIWTLSSSGGARSWWPCKDVLSDKPDSVDIRVTVPSELIVASNGSLRQTNRDGNKTTYWWHEKYPIATYLVSLAIHPYEMHYDQYLYNNDLDTMAIHFYSVFRVTMRQIIG